MIFATTVQAKLVSNEVSYQLDGKEFKGYLAYDEAIKGKRPGVLVVHEWWGHTEFARERARALARMGYVAFSLDMYGDGKTADHPKDAGRFSGQVKSNMAAAQARFLAAREQLLASKVTDQDKIAAIGYCFGGGIVLEMARRGVNLDGVVSFHGSLGTEQPASKGEVKAKVLVFNGADDPFVKPESITAFKREMQQAGVDFTFVSVPGAKHSFTNPAATANGKKFDLPLEYNKQAAQSTWQQMKSFFDEIFN
ncbi:MAG: dienelactone hydrolase family protein [Thioalkalispiraceae bacterium]